MIFFDKIAYQMTDATAHNMDNDETVAEDLEVDHIQDHILC